MLYYDWVDSVHFHVGCGGRVTQEGRQTEGEVRSCVAGRMQDSVCVDWCLAHVLVVQAVQVGGDRISPPSWQLVVVVVVEVAWWWRARYWRMWERDYPVIVECPASQQQYRPSTHRDYIHVRTPVFSLHFPPVFSFKSLCSPLTSSQSRVRRK